MSNIQTGCIAIIIKSKMGNNGKIVTVGKHLGRINGWKSEFWEIDTTVKALFLMGSGIKDVNYVPEEHLMRIDDGELKEGEETHYETKNAEEVIINHLEHFWEQL